VGKQKRNAPDARGTQETVKEASAGDESKASVSPDFQRATTVEGYVQGHAVKRMPRTKHNQKKKEAPPGPTSDDRLKAAG